MRSLLAIDASTVNIGLAIFNDTELGTWGKIKFNGNSISEKMLDAYDKLDQLFNYLVIDDVVIESAFAGANPRTGMNLSIMQGVVLAVAMNHGAHHIGFVSPLTWQSYIGNPQLTRAEKTAIIEEYPGKSNSWYKNHGKATRKERTIKLVSERYGIKVADNDAADAIGIGTYAVNDPKGVQW